MANTPITLSLLVLSVALHAEDAPTVEQLQAQLAAKDQQITQLQRQITESQRDTFLYRQAFNACVDQSQAKPALNPQQERMMKRQAPEGKP